MRKETFPENGSQKVHQFLFSLSCRQGTEKARTNIPALNCVTDAGLPKKESPHSLDVAYPGGFEPLTPRVGEVLARVWKMPEKQEKCLFMGIFLTLLVSK